MSCAARKVILVMPDFRFIAIDAKGREKKAYLTALDIQTARGILNARQFHILLLEEETERAGEAENKRAALSSARWTWSVRRAKLTRRELMLLTRQLATLCEVIPLEEALHTLGRQSGSMRSRAIVASVHMGLIEGCSLAEAMARETASFPPLYRAMIAAGEETGTLDAILTRLAALLERQADVRGKLIAALAYPVVLALVAVSTVLALMIFVVPRIVEQFDDVGQELPWLTRAVIALSDFAVGWWWLIVLLLVLVALSLARAVRVARIRRWIDTILLRLPLLGRLLRDLYAARFARTLATMIASRLPLVEGLRLTIPTIRNRALAEATQTIVERVRAGENLASGLRGAGVFPPLLVYMTASGESAGRLDVMLERAADYLEREFDRFMATSMALLEPVIIVLMGACVALIILSILLPILQLQNLAGL